MTRLRARTAKHRIGAALVVLYVAVVVATMNLGSHRVRPLFEGFTPPPPYEWVSPPKEFRAGNQKPVAVDTDITLNPKGSIAIGVTSSDSQFILNLPDGAIASHGSDVSANAHMDPLDPSKLGALPSGLAADGNAYRLQLTYQPSHAEITHLAKPGNVFLTVPQPAIALLYSSDGRRWTTLHSDPAGGPAALGATLTDAGWFLAAMPPGASPKRSSPVGTIAVAVVTVLLALALFFGPALVRRVRGRAVVAVRRRPRAAPRVGHLNERSAVASVDEGRHRAHRTVMAMLACPLPLAPRRQRCVTQQLPQQSSSP